MMFMNKLIRCLSSGVLKEQVRPVPNSGRKQWKLLPKDYVTPE